MIVVVVIAFLLAMTAPTMFSNMRASELSTQGDLLKNRLSLAQQTALSSNSDVEIRFFKYADTSNAEVLPRFRGFRFYQYNELGKLVPVSELFNLTGSVMISDEKTYSTIISEMPEKDLPPNDLVQFSIGVKEVDYVAFRYLPDGSTTLPKTGETWFLTLLEDQGVANAATREINNYFCIQIDPFNGSMREYRPGT